MGCPWITFVDGNTRVAELTPHGTAAEPKPKQHWLGFIKVVVGVVAGAQGLWSTEYESSDGSWGNESGPLLGTDRLA